MSQQTGAMTRKPLSEPVAKEFSRLRIAMMDNYPFFAQLAMYLHPVSTPEIPTLAVDIKGNLYINEGFFTSLLKDPKDLLFVLAHEIMHLATDTHRRAPPVVLEQLWNQASDIVINSILVDSGLKLPDPNVIKPLHKQHVPELAKYDGQATEQIYYDLMRLLEKELQKMQGKKSGGQGQGTPGQGQPGGCPGHSTGGSGDGRFKGMWWDSSGTQVAKGKDGSGKDKAEGKGAGSNGTVAEGVNVDELRQEWQDRVASAAAGAKNVGKLPGPLGQFCTDLLQPKKNWRRELSRYVSTLLRGGWTWRKPSRRTAGIVRTPGKLPDPPRAVVYIDTSGSISDGEIIRALSEIKSIIDICGGKSRLLLGDAEIYYDGEISSSALKDIPVQRGGTDFNCLFDAIGDDKPDVLIAFTDLYGPFPERAPRYPVIWCCYENNHGECPWGKLIEVEIGWRK